MKTLVEFCESEPRLKPKMIGVLRPLFENQKSKSLLYELILTVINLKIAELETAALKNLVQDFMEQDDANLRMLGVQGLKLAMDKSDDKAKYVPRLLKKLVDEKEQGITNYLIRTVTDLMDNSNYKQILSCLIQKYKED